MESLLNISLLESIYIGRHGELKGISVALIINTTIYYANLKFVKKHIVCKFLSATATFI